MKIALITGDHQRHAYLASRLAATGKLAGWVVEEREAFLPAPPPGLPAETEALFERHFRLREEAETAVFGTPQVDVSRYGVSREDLNAPATIDFLRSLAPDLVLSYGCHKLEAPLREAVGATFWNTHGGLSPQYRGVITHFWPSYMLEPQMTGVTLHETTDELDGGAIIHQSGAVLQRGDGVHLLAARTVKAYADTIGPLLARLDPAALPAGIRQKSTGKLWTSRDWRPEHLHLVYDDYGDRIVDAVLDGRLEGREPKLLSVLEPQGG